MADPRPFLLFLLSFFLIHASSTEINTAAPAPTHRNFIRVAGDSCLAPILSRLGFQEMSSVAPFLFASIENHTNIASSWLGPLTIFAPSDSSIDGCAACSLPLLLQEHTVPGLYTFNYLQSLLFGTKIQSLIHNRCLTVTKSVNVSVNASNGGGEEKVFIGGLEVTHPDLYNDGYFVIHGIDGFVSHLSPLSCEIEKSTSLQFHPEASAVSAADSSIGRNVEEAPAPRNDNAIVMRVMLDDATLRLRAAGFSTLALALKIRYEELLQFQFITIFAVDDIAVFRAGHGYVENLGFHIVPNRLITADELMSLVTQIQIQTMEPGNNLIITSNSSNGSQLKINYVAVVSLGLISNMRVMVHEITEPFSHIGIGIRPPVESLRGRIKGSSGLEFKRSSNEYGDYSLEQAPVFTDAPSVAQFDDDDDYHGL